MKKILMLTVVLILVFLSSCCGKQKKEVVIVESCSPCCVGVHHGHFGHGFGPGPMMHMRGSSYMHSMRSPAPMMEGKGREFRGGQEFNRPNKDQQQDFNRQGMRGREMRGQEFNRPEIGIGQKEQGQNLRRQNRSGLENRPEQNQPK